MVSTGEGDEMSAGDTGGQLAPCVERTYDVAPHMHDKNRRLLWPEDPRCRNRRRHRNRAAHSGEVVSVAALTSSYPASRPNSLPQHTDKSVPGSQAEGWGLPGARNRRRLGLNRQQSVDVGSNVRFDPLRLLI